ncbi:MAG: hypothetical protein ACR2JC_00390 [Chloroflexota bacterium]
MLVRYLTHDDPDRAAGAEAYLHGQRRDALNHPTIDVPGKEVWLEVADDIEAGRDPVDAYLLRTAERMGIPSVTTFDGSMKPLATVRCESP